MKIMTMRILALTFILVTLIFCSFVQNLPSQLNKFQISFASTNNNSHHLVHTNNNNVASTGVISDEDNNTQVWIDKLNNIKIIFTNFPKYPFVDNDTVLKFSIQNLQTNNNLKDVFAEVTVINNSTAAASSKFIKQDSNGDVFSTFNNIIAPQGIFSIKCKFREDQTDQVIVKINSNGLSTLASFNVLVQRLE